VSRTLVISDLHIGTVRRVCVLTRPAALNALLEALDGCERLVLLGDTIELVDRSEADALAAAEPILRAIGTRIGADGEVILVPGNHDRALIRRWLRAHAGQLTADSAIPSHATPVLARVSEWLAPARVTTRYPGVWLSARVWATHGHYLDRHLFPFGAYGIAHGLGSGSSGTAWTPLDYERALRPERRMLDMRLPGPFAELLEDLSELARAWTMPRVGRRRRRSRRRLRPSRLVRWLLHPRFAPVTAALLGGQMQRFSIPALVTVIEHLGIDADWVLFGHVHRLGPLPGDDPAQWAGPEGWPRLANAGSWQYEPLLVHRVTPPHPYWPGGAIILDEGADPRAVGLLDGLAPGELARIGTR
jgi:calcineurin-like phosphoesterase family protein